MSRARSNGTGPRELSVYDTPSLRPILIFTRSLVQALPVANRRGSCDWQMTWFINMGEDIQRNQEIKFSFYRSIDEDYTPSDLIFTDTLYECADPYVQLPNPGFAVPDPLTATPMRRHAPRHRSKGNKIGPNCKVTADLRSVSSNRFNKRIDREGKP